MVNIISSIDKGQLHLKQFAVNLVTVNVTRTILFIAMHLQI